jgi:hypothetical protein
MHRRHDGAWFEELLLDATGSGTAPLSLVPALHTHSERMMTRLNGVTEYLLYQRPREVGDTAQQMEEITQKANAPKPFAHPSAGGSGGGEDWGCGAWVCSCVCVCEWVCV